MDLPVDSWHEAIFRRHSRRRFDGNVPDEQALSRLRWVCERFRPFAEARAVLVEQADPAAFSGVIGAYGQVKGAPCYIALVGSMDSPWVQERVGYTGEGLILEATALGLETCWVGGFFRPHLVARAIPLDAGEKVLAITPVGHASGRTTVEERTMKAILRAGRRLSLDRLATGMQPHRRPPWVRRALEAARPAPSAINRQPWRFTVQEDGIIVETVLRGRGSGGVVNRRLDCGIAMLHLELGARAAGVRGRWEPLDPPRVARYRVP